MEMWDGRQDRIAWGKDKGAMQMNAVNVGASYITAGQGW
jgi:hypothetical protein